MNKQLLKLYQQEQFSYYTQQGYSFYHFNYTGFRAKNTIISILNEEEYNQINTILTTQTAHLYSDSCLDKVDFPKKIESIDNYLASMLIHLRSHFSIMNINDKTQITPFNFEFYFHFFMKYPEWQEELLGAYSLINEISWATDKQLYTFVDRYARSFSDIKKFIELYPEFILDNDFTIDRLVNIFQKNNTSEEQINHFLFNYLKSYETELNNHSYIASFRKSLLQRFTEQELVPYCEFFPSLQHYFNPPPIKIFVEKYDYTINSLIDHASLQKTLIIDDYNRIQYHFVLSSFTETFSQFYQLDFHKIHDLNIQDTDTQQVILLHNNPHVTKAFFEQRLLQFYQYLAENPKVDFRDSSVVSSWLNYMNLNEELTQPVIKNKQPKI